MSLYDYSGVWCEPYRQTAGYTVVQYDIKPKPNAPFWYAQQDVRLDTINKNYLKHGVYGILAVPPCTMFANSGARWKRTNEQMVDALSMVDAVLRLVTIYKPKFWALENPVGKLSRFLGKPRLVFQPYEYGDAYRKKTCLWGNSTAPQKNVVTPLGVNKGKPDDWYNKVGGKSDKTKEYRSITPQGFAKAFFEANR